MKRIAPFCLVVLTTLLILGCGNSDNFVFTNTNGVVAGVPGVPAKLAFVQNPAQTTNTDFSTPPIVEVQDAFGNRVPGATNTITVSLVNPGTAVLNGTTTRDAVDGRATFTGLSVSEPGSFTLTCSAQGLTGATSASFTVSDAFVPQGLVLYAIAAPRGGMGLLPSQLVQLDPTTGEYIGTLGFLQAPNITEGFVDVECLPDGTTYSLGYDGTQTHLVQINLSNPSASTDLGVISGTDAAYSLAYDSNNQILYALVEDAIGDYYIATINTTSPAATLAPQAAVIPNDQGLSLAFDDSTNTLYLTGTDDFYSVDTSTGLVTLIGNGTLGNLDGNVGSKGIKGLDFNPSTNMLFSASRGGGVVSGAGSQVGNINPADGTGTEVGTSPQCAGLSFCENSPVGVASPPRQTGYTVESITQAFEAITGTNLNLSDDDKSTQSIGFTFNFNGTNYTDVVIDANGYVSFVDTDFTDTPRILPADNLSNDSLMPWWDDLDATNPSASVRVETLGTTPNQRMVIQYAAMEHGSPTITGNITFEIILYETTNVIEFHYADTTFDGVVDGGRTAVVGIQANDTTADLWSAFQNVLTDTTAIRFTPAP